MVASGFLTGTGLRLLHQEGLCCPTSSSVPFTLLQAGEDKMEKCRQNCIASERYSFRLERERRGDLPSMNPLASGTQIDEDFIGRVCAISRTVSGRKLHTRTLRKYSPCTPHGMVSCRALAGPRSETAPEAAAARVPIKDGF